ncbi:hypothetical protein CsSME_00043298 [Camellia sinensis var. sinensis]
MKSISKMPHNKLPLASLLYVLSLAALFNSFLGLFFFQFSYLTTPTPPPLPKKKNKNPFNLSPKSISNSKI